MKIFGKYFWIFFVIILIFTSAKVYFTLSEEIDDLSHASSISIGYPFGMVSQGQPCKEVCTDGPVPTNHSGKQREDCHARCTTYYYPANIFYNFLILFGIPIIIQLIVNKIIIKKTQRIRR